MSIGQHMDGAILQQQAAPQPVDEIAGMEYNGYHKTLTIRFKAGGVKVLHGFDAIPSRLRPDSAITSVLLAKIEERPKTDGGACG